eukprot:349823-Chlamydomonas_euryale.AAC.5
MSKGIARVALNVDVQPFNVHRSPFAAFSVKGWGTVAWACVPHTDGCHFPASARLERAGAVREALE